MIARAARLSLAALWLGCSGPSEVEREPDPEPAPTLEPDTAADPARGRALMARLECNRCHAVDDLPAEPEARHCVRCHQSIRAGTFDASPSQLRRWRRHLHGLEDVPSLTNLGDRLRADWIAAFLVSPHDVRPALRAMMPRLPIGPDEAADIAAALTDGSSPSVAYDSAPELGDPRLGLALLREEGCLTCHAFSGAFDDGDTAEDAESRAAARGPALQLAPDLRFTRDRMSREMLLRWLRAPDEVQPGTAMPTPALTEAERAQIADAVLGAPLADATEPPIPERLPILERPVAFAEVSDRVLSVTCWHCHADADFARGDGGAGNTGGFGFSARGVDLSSYAGASSGYFAEDGERRSLFAPDEDGTPHLVRVLMARHAEVRGRPVQGVTGMPLGLPPLSLEDVQLVESWIAQGRPD